MSRLSQNFDWFILVGFLLLMVVLFLGTFSNVRKPVDIKSATGSAARANELISKPFASERLRYQAPVFLQQPPKCNCGECHQ